MSRKAAKFRSVQQVDQHTTKANCETKVRYGIDGIRYLVGANEQIMVTTDGIRALQQLGFVLIGEVGKTN
jgi:hypothetical protein